MRACLVVVDKELLEHSLQVAGAEDEQVVERHIATAAEACSSLRTKNVTPPTLRHSCAMNLLRHDVDSATIALVLGYEDVRTTYGVYLHADLRLKERAIARTEPLNLGRGPYRPSDRLLAFLENL